MPSRSQLSPLPKGLERLHCLGALMMESADEHDGLSFVVFRSRKNTPYFSLPPRRLYTLCLLREETYVRVQY